MLDLISLLIEEYEKLLRDMVKGNELCNLRFGRDLYPENEINLVKGILHDLNLLKAKVTT